MILTSSSILARYSYFLLNLSYDKQIINQKHYYKFGTKMDDIIKYTCGWLNSIDIQNK